MLKNRSYEAGYKDAMELAAIKLHEIEGEQGKINQAVQETLEKFAKESGPFKRKKYFKILESYRFKDKIRIKVVQNGEEKFAEDIRKSLRHGDNDVFCVRYESFKKNLTDNTDYTIFVGNLHNELPRNAVTIKEKFGCLMKESDGNIFLCYDPNGVRNINQFKQYYETVIKDEVEFCHQLEEVENIIKNIGQERDIKTLSFYEKFIKMIKNSTDKVSDKSKALGLVYLIYSITTMVTPVTFFVLNIGTAECIANIIRQEALDKKNIPIAQKQILQIWLCDYFRANTNER